MRDYIDIKSLSKLFKKNWKIEIDRILYDIAQNDKVLFEWSIKGIISNEIWRKYLRKYS